jgi:REP element-mobilizing transposase RayT
MGRPHRFLDNDSGVVELTSRCVQGRFLMRPSSEVNDRILGVIGRAQRQTGVRLFAFNYQSNHVHELCGVDSVEQMAAYQRFLKGNLARELGRHYNWKEKFWGRRYHSACLADNEVDQQKRLRYILANGCKAGLVDSPLDWPGVSTAWALSRGLWTLTSTWLDRSSQRSGRGESDPVEVEETVHLSPLPFMEHWSKDRRRQWFCDIIRDIEQEARERKRTEGRRSVGVKRVLEQDPHDMPQNFRPSPAPLFHATSDVERRKLRFARELKEAAYRFAAEQLRRGILDVVFPEDCFLPPHVRAKRGPP